MRISSIDISKIKKYDYSAQLTRCENAIHETILILTSPV